jgi:hypothetical protein
MEFDATHPIGLRRRSGPEIRSVGPGNGPFNRDGNVLQTAGEIAAGSVIWLMEGDAASGLIAAEGTCQEAVSALGGRAPQGVIAFDCATRRDLCGAERTIVAMSKVVEESHGAGLVGGYLWGQYARQPGNGVYGYYNQSLAVLTAG